MHSQYIDLVERFHERFSYRFPSPAMPAMDDECAALRVELLREELLGKNELWDSLTADDRHGILDGLCDFQYVLSGAVLALGFRTLFDLAMPRGTQREPFFAPLIMNQLKVNQLTCAIDRLESMLRAKQVPASVECLMRMQLVLGSLIHSTGFSPVFDRAFADVHENNIGKVWSETEISAYQKYVVTNKPHRFEIVDGVFYVARRYDGKIAKPPTHKPVDLTKYL